MRARRTYVLYEHVAGCLRKRCEMNCLLGYYWQVCYAILMAFVPFQFEHNQSFKRTNANGIVELVQRKFSITQFESIKIVNNDNGIKENEQTQKFAKIASPSLTTA